MAETLKTSFHPWRYILIVVALFVLAGVLSGATNILGLIGLAVALMAVVALVWFIANLIERRQRIRAIDKRLQYLAVAREDAPRSYRAVALLDAETEELKAERDTLTGWLAK